MYRVYCNLKFVATVDTPEEVWEIIGKLPFGAGYQVESDTADVSEFIPF